MTKITKDTTLAELLEDPQAQGVLAKNRLPCLSCPFAQQEIQTLKLGDVCRMYGIDLEKVLEDLKGVYKKKG